MDCGFKSEGGVFRFRAAAIIVEDGCVLMAKNDHSPYYYSVGGAVCLNESATDAVRREVFEETGVHFEVDRLAFIHENFFVEKGADNKNLPWHEVAFYFLMKPNGIKEFNCQSYVTSGAKEQVCWVPIKDIEKLEFFPTFFKDKLLNLKNEIEHIVTYE